MKLKNKIYIFIGIIMLIGAINAQGQGTQRVGGGNNGIDSTFIQGDSVFIASGGQEYFSGAAASGADGNGIYGGSDTLNQTVTNVSIGANQNLSFGQYYGVNINESSLGLLGVYRPIKFGGAVNSAIRGNVSLGLGIQSIIESSATPPSNDFVVIGNNSYPLFRTRKIDGTIASKVPVANNKKIYELLFEGYYPGGYQRAGSITVVTTSDWATNQAAKMQLESGVIESIGNARFNQYGLGNKEASDLSKIESSYAAVFATDGTLLEKSISSLGDKTIDTVRISVNVLKYNTQLPAASTVLADDFFTVPANLDGWHIRHIQASVFELAAAAGTYEVRGRKLDVARTGSTAFGTCAINTSAGAGATVDVVVSENEILHGIVLTNTDTGNAPVGVSITYMLTRN